MISKPSNHRGILLRQTKKYWFYLMEGMMCRISKIHLWDSIDRNNVQLHYGTNMKKRRDRKKNRLLDLHGVSHADASEKIRKFFNFAETPVKVITGNSQKMKEILFSIVKEYDWSILHTVSSNTEFTISE